MVRLLTTKQRVQERVNTNDLLKEAGTSILYISSLRQKFVSLQNKEKGKRSRNLLF
jgi:hypothetical protein